jgi:hypothetical protein
MLRGWLHGIAKNVGDAFVSLFLLTQMIPRSLNRSLQGWWYNNANSSSTASLVPVTQDDSDNIEITDEVAQHIEQKSL